MGLAQMAMDVAAARNDGTRPGNGHIPWTREESTHEFYGRASAEYYAIIDRLTRGEEA